jgi:hypothetical protein
MADAVRRKYLAVLRCREIDAQLKALRKLRRKENKKLGDALKDIYRLAAVLPRKEPT